MLATEVTFTTVERKAYADALARLTGVQHGTRLPKWRAFWAEHGARLLARRGLRAVNPKTP